MRIKSRKLISLFLSILMILSIVPTNILADNIWVNMDGYNSGGSSGGGRIESRFVNNLNSMNGYKVSVWYCPMTGTDAVEEYDEHGQTVIRSIPTFDWSAETNAAFQAGKTIYLRRQDIKTKQDEYVLPNVYNTDTIYSQTTRGKTWDMGKKLTSNQKFEYFSTYWLENIKNNNPQEYNRMVANFVEQNSNSLKTIWSYIPFEKEEKYWNVAEKGLVDWVQRIYNMENPRSVNIDNIEENLSYNGRDIGQFGVHDADSFQLCFPEAMAKGSDKSYKASIEYLKSYFLSPVILNEIFYLTRRNQNADKGEISVKDFLMGTYSYKYVDENGFEQSYYSEKGMYKIYIEPVAYRAYNDSDGLMCMSWRDMMLEHQSKNGKKNGFVSMNDFATQYSNAFDLSEKDDSLQYNGVALGVKNGVFNRTGALSQSQVIPTAKDNSNTLGAAIITSPSLAAYIDFYEPEIIKTYVMLTGVNDDGTFKYEKIAKTRKEYLDSNDFYMEKGFDDNGHTKYYMTNIPKIEQIAKVDGGTAYLNDILTTDKLLDINENTEWTNTKIITGVTVRNDEEKRELYANSNDIVGYKVGVLTGSDLFIESVVDISAEKIYKAMKENNKFNSKDFGTIADMVQILEKTGKKYTEKAKEYNMISPSKVQTNLIDAVAVAGFINTRSSVAWGDLVKKYNIQSSTGVSLNDDEYEKFKDMTETLEATEEFGSLVDATVVNSSQNLDSAAYIVKAEEERNAVVYDTILSSEDGWFLSLDDFKYQKESKSGDFTYTHEYVKDNVLSLGFVYYEDEGLRASNRTLTNEFRFELLEKYFGQTMNEEMDKIVAAPKTANTVILRYIVIPTAQQVDLVDLYKDGVKVGSIVGEKQTLELNGNTATIQKPKVSVDGTPKLVEYVSNGDYPMKDISDGTLPAKTIDGVEGTLEGTISDYPLEPLPHNLYVRWKVEIEDDDGEEGDVVQAVPEWRLSKYFGTNVIDNGYTYMTLPISYGCCGDAKLDGSYNYVSRPYTVVNANGNVNDGSYSPTNMKYKSWIHSATENMGVVDSVGVDKRTSTVPVDGIINAVKSTETSGLKAANWIQSEWTNNNYLNSGYDVQSSAISSQFNSAEHQKYVLSDTLKLNTLNTKSYTNTWPNRHSHKKGGHCHRWVNSKTIGTTSPSYIPYYLDTEIIFERYNQVNTDSRLLSVASKTETENTYTTLTYQPGDTIKVYPEYGMLFTSDSNDGDSNASKSSIKWMVSDQARSIKPAIYQTLRFKVFVQPNSTGSSVATDSRALTAKNKIADATAKNKQMIYKGSSVNTAFQLYRDNSKNTAALLTVKTFALDYNDEVKTSDGKTVQNAWGMDAYKPEKYHTNLMTDINKKATAYEKLYIKEDGATYNGGVKQQQTNEFTLSGSNYTTFVHKLIIRGGKLIGVKVQDRNDKSYTTMTMAQLKANNTYADLYDAIIESKLYNESNDKNATVLSTFEHQTGNALSEDLYVNKLEVARQNIDGITTPDSSKVVMNAGWYSEDTTVLVMKEYITNYKVPSISFSDKLSLQITGLNTPMNKTEFFNKVARGHVYLKYDLGVKTAMGENTNVYFEYDSSNTYQISNKVKVADRKMGYVGTDYIVPNVSITDTTRQ